MPASRMTANLGVGEQSLIIALLILVEGERLTTI
jgi:hypothetical protein